MQERSKDPFHHAQFNISNKDPNTTIIVCVELKQISYLELEKGWKLDSFLFIIWRDSGKKHHVKRLHIGDEGVSP